jgi:hypothetical protein
MIPRSNLFQTLNIGNQSAQGTPTTLNATSNKANTTCFNYGQKGYYANCCPSRLQSSSLTHGAPAPPNRNGSSTPTQAQQGYAWGRMNQMTMDEALTPPLHDPVEWNLVEFHPLWAELELPPVGENGATTSRARWPLFCRERRSQPSIARWVARIRSQCNGFTYWVMVIHLRINALD